MLCHVINIYFFPSVLFIFHIIVFLRGSLISNKLEFKFEIEHGLCACRVDNPLLKLGDYLIVQAHKPCSISHLLFCDSLTSPNMHPALQMAAMTASQSETLVSHT